MRAYNVADARSDKEQSGSYFSLRVTSGILPGPRVDERGNAGIYGDDVVSDEENGSVGGSSACDEEDDAACDWGEAEEEENGRFHVYFIGDPGAAESGNHLHGTEGDVEEDCSEGVEAEGLDDERAKSRNASAGDAVVFVDVSRVIDMNVLAYGNLRNGEHEAEPEPRLWIEHGFADVVPFPDAGANAHLVHAETLDGDDFFVFFEEFGFHWGVRHEEAV